MQIKTYLAVLGSTFSCLSFGIAAAAPTEADPPLIDASVYGAYNAVGTEPPNTTPLAGHGGGAGVDGKIFLPAHLFAETNYQYVRLNGTQNGAEASAGTNQLRAGLGLSFDVGALPLALFGKYNYVHYEYQALSAGAKGPRVSDDGSGVDFGARLNLDRLKVSAAAGYLDIGSKRGPETIARLEMPFGVHFYGFGEYRYDWLKNADDDDKLRLIDYHLGVGLRF